MSSRALEELTHNAWPPLHTLLLDGWLLGFAGGYTRRANSVQPLYASSLPLEAKIATCEQLYAAHGRPITFKITSAPADPDLDAVLATRGYAAVAPTSVQITSRLPDSADASVSLSTELTEPWFAAFNHLTVTPESIQDAERQLLEKILPPHCFASMEADGETVAVGLAVAERGHVGLFDIVVDARIRNQGLGRRVCSALLHWGRTAQGADTGYLAVMQGNDPALHLYAQLGFTEQYTYWYRVRPD